MIEAVQHSMFPPFEERGDESDFALYWQMYRDCFVLNNNVSLTKAVNSQAGAVWNKTVSFSGNT